MAVGLGVPLPDFWRRISLTLQGRMTAQSRKLLTISHEWRLKSTQKYGLDSLLGVNWESVSTVGFATQWLLPIL